jgi:hypothetical protein
MTRDEAETIADFAARELVDKLANNERLAEMSEAQFDAMEGDVATAILYTLEPLCS